MGTAGAGGVWVPLLPSPGLCERLLVLHFLVNWGGASFPKSVQGSSWIFPKQVYSLLWDSVSLSVKCGVSGLALCSLKPQASLEMVLGFLDYYVRLNILNYIILLIGL